MIYILEDDASIRKLVVYTIQSQGMEAEGFERPSQFWSALEQKIPELLLMMLPIPILLLLKLLKMILILQIILRIIHFPIMKIKETNLLEEGQITV